MRNLHTVYHSSLYFHQRCPRIPFSSHSNKYLLSLVFLIIAILMCMRWYLIVVLICISLMINGVEQLFMCLLAIYMLFFFWKISIQILCLFLSYILFCFWVVCIFCIINPLLDMCQLIILVVSRIHQSLSEPWLNSYYFTYLSFPLTLILSG